MDSIRYAIITTQRTGSHFLRSVLRKHPLIECVGELLLPQAYPDERAFYTFWHRKIQDDPMELTFPRFPYVFKEYCDFLFSSVPGKRYVGLDLKYDTIEFFPNLLTRMAENDIRCIHLIRKNILRTVVSAELNFRKKELGRDAHNTSDIAAVRIFFEPDKVVHRLVELSQQIQVYRDYLPKIFPEVLEVTYESFFEGLPPGANTVSREVLGNIYRFLGCSDEPAQEESPLKRTNPQPLSEILENYDEVSRAVSDVGFAYLLEYS